MSNKIRQILTTVPIFAASLVTSALAQDAAAPPAPPESGQGEPISTLMFFTFAAAIAIAIGALVMFLRKRSNRDATEKVLNPRHPSNQ